MAVRVEVYFSPPVNKDNLSRLPVHKKKEIIAFVSAIYGRKATDTEVLAFLQFLNLKDKESKTNE